MRKLKQHVSNLEEQMEIKRKLEQVEQNTNKISTPLKMGLFGAFMAGFLLARKKRNYKELAKKTLKKSFFLTKIIKSFIL